MSSNEGTGSLDLISGEEEKRQTADIQEERY